MEQLRSKGKRVAIVAGLRTPFAKRDTAYGHLSALELGKMVVSELLQRTNLRPREIQQLVYGQVIPSIEAPNIAREVVLGTGMPRNIEAFSVSRACATSYQSTVSILEAIVSGAIDCGIAGGADSASDIPMTISKRLGSALQKASGAKHWHDRLTPFRSLELRDFAPIPPTLKEISTGLSMGESAEKMAKENHISREDQDAFAHRSHQRSAEAWQNGWFADQVMPAYIPPSFNEVVAQDNLVRADSKLEAYSKLKPVFDRQHGTVTAGNSSPLTDGASALLIMREDKAKALGFNVLGFVRSYAFAALDPSEQLLMGPAYATPTALRRGGVSLSDIDLIDMHEAFAAQVLSNTQAFESDVFAQQKLGLERRIGEIPWDRFNVTGGSIALGHPFAATGARQIHQSLRDLQRLDGTLALCTACAAGGLGAAMVLERAS